MSDQRRELAHEVRAPVGAILAAAEQLLAEAALPAGQHELLVALRNQADWLQRLAGNLLATEQQALVPCNPVAVVRETVRLFAPVARRAGLELHCLDRTGVRLELSGGELALRQALANLLGNALKFTDEGTVRVELSLTAAGDVQVAVEDTGIGMNAEELTAALAGLAPGPRRRGGLGLGLATARRLLQRLGGRLDGTSTLGTGSRFVVQLPVQRLAGMPTPLPLAMAPGLRCLVVDPSPTIRLLVAAVLASDGATVELCVDATQARARCQASDRPVGVAMLGAATGAGLMAELRERAPQIRIIALGWTEHGDPPPDALVPRPYTRSGLLAALAAVMAPASRTR